MWSGICVGQWPTVTLTQSWTNFGNLFSFVWGTHIPRITLEVRSQCFTILQFILLHYHCMQFTYSSCSDCTQFKLTKAYQRKSVSLCRVEKKPAEKVLLHCKSSLLHHPCLSSSTAQCLSRSMMCPSRCMPANQYVLPEKWKDTPQKKNEICMLNPASNKTLFCWYSFQTYVRLKLLANTGHHPLWSCFRGTSIPSKFLLNEDYFSGHWKFPASESCCIISCLGKIIILNNSKNNIPWIFSLK